MGQDAALGPNSALGPTLARGERARKRENAALGPDSALGPTLAREERARKRENARNYCTAPTPYSPSAGVLARETNRKAVGVV